MRTRCLNPEHHTWLEQKTNSLVLHSSGELTKTHRLCQEAQIRGIVSRISYLFASDFPLAPHSSSKWHLLRCKKTTWSRTRYTIWRQRYFCARYVTSSHSWPVHVEMFAYKLNAKECWRRVADFIAIIIIIIISDIFSVSSVFIVYRRALVVFLAGKASVRRERENKQRKKNIKRSRSQTSSTS